MTGDPFRIHVIQGRHAVSGDPRAVMSTILGSCVAACLRDPLLGIGGMNHFLLPSAPGGTHHEDQRYGVQAMELLINALLKMGARRERLEAKAFGGARMAEGLADIGGRNAEFVRRFMRDEDIPLVGESLGGRSARRIHFEPGTGRVRQQVVIDPAITLRESRQTPAQPPTADPSGDLELFA